MNVESILNSALSKVFGRDCNGDSKVRFHSQNMNKSETGFPVHGRCWLYTGQKTTRVEWSLWSHFCSAGLSTDPHDRATSLHASVPPISLWVNIPINSHKLIKNKFWKRWNNKYDGYENSHEYTSFSVFEFGFRMEDKAIYWESLKFDWGWSSKMPKWMSGSFNPVDFVLGKTKYESKKLATHEVAIPMPEGSYPATITMDYTTWKRPRSPFYTKKGYYADIKMKKPIPHQGKGESDYDCGGDALHGLSREAKTVEEAIAATVKCALESRRKYDGNVMAEYPDPREEVADV